jgi:hypothetical protein
MEDLVNLMTSVTNLDLSLNFKFFKDRREWEDVGEGLKGVETLVLAIGQQGTEVSATVELFFLQLFLTLVFAAATILALF